MLKKLIIIIFVFIIFTITSQKVYSQDIKTDYQTEYFLNDNVNNLETKVKLNIKITYFKSDILVDKFTLFFADNFTIRNITASLNNEPLSSIITPIDKKIKIELDLSQSKIGKGNENKIALEFYQDNLFKIDGNIWEVILPKIETKDADSYRIVVNLPKNTSKKISISKPKPDSITANQIIWENVKNKTVYAVFGNSQIYDLKLDYHLKNPDLLPVYNYIAIPPDTLFQKTYLNNLDPKPVAVEIDTDGNFLAKYLIKPKEVKTIVYKGLVEVFAEPRGEIIPLLPQELQKQEEYLLLAQKYWLITKPQKFQDLKKPEEIYDFVVSNLKYNYDRAKTKDKRLGADKILENTKLATCVDFTDLFITLSRQKGIRSREIEGYAFSQDSNLRPISTVTDILHSWPEYYDTKDNIWVPIDPTWENTSGIDYFHSLDINHIAFVIHGKDSEYPLPAGMYKVTDSKDVSVNISNTTPKEKIDLTVKNTDINKNINDKDNYKAKIILKNNSNVYLWNFYIDVLSDDLKIDPVKIHVDSIAPYNIKEIEFSYQSKLQNVNKKTNLSLIAFNKPLIDYNIDITSFYLKEFKSITVVSFITIFLIGFVIIIRKIRYR